jgi:adenylate cyclase
MLSDATGVLDNTPEVAQQLRYSGFLNTKADADGVLRRMPLLIRYGGLVQPQLALATFMRTLGADHAVIEQGLHGLSIRVGKRAIPINRQGVAVLRVKGPSSAYPAVPALEVLNGNVAPATLAGKTVFIGSSAAGLNDLHSTLFDAQFPGLKVQAAIADDIDSGAFIREPSWAGAAVMGACLLVGLLMSLIFTLLREPLPICVATVTLAGGAVAAAAALFAATGIYLSPAFPVLLATLLFLGLTTTRFAVEKRRAYAWFRKLANAQQVAMESMAAVAETRDPETGAHIKRTQHYVKAIAETLRENGHYTETLTTDFIALLFASAPLHDIGKVGVPDHILLKPGKLTADEFELMKKHAEYGRDIIHSAADKIEGENFLNVAGEIAYGHHEKWDGSGYPQALQGQRIPLSARIMTVADVYDALISRRCYKEPFPHEQAFEMMRAERGRIFDPVVLDCFFSIEATIRDIASTYRDEHEMVLGDR